MIDPRVQKSRVSLGGKIGQEIRHMWDAIHRNRLISGVNSTVSRTTQGTIWSGSSAGASTIHRVAHRPIHLARYTGTKTEPSESFLQDCTIDGSSETFTILLPPIDRAIIEGASKKWIEPWSVKRRENWDYGDPWEQWVDPAGADSDTPPPWMEEFTLACDSGDHKILDRHDGAFSACEFIGGAWFPHNYRYPFERFPHWACGGYRGSSNEVCSVVGDGNLRDAESAVATGGGGSPESLRFKWHWNEKLTTDTTFWCVKGVAPAWIYYDPDSEYGTGKSIENTVQYFAIGPSKWVPASEATI